MSISVTKYILRAIPIISSIIALTFIITVNILFKIESEESIYLDYYSTFPSKDLKFISKIERLYGEEECEKQGDKVISFTYTILEGHDCLNVSTGDVCENKVCPGKITDFRKIKGCKEIKPKKYHIKYWLEDNCFLPTMTDYGDYLDLLNRLKSKNECKDDMNLVNCNVSIDSYGNHLCALPNESCPFVTAKKNIIKDFSFKFEKTYVLENDTSKEDQGETLFHSTKYSLFLYNMILHEMFFFPGFNFDFLMNAKANLGIKKYKFIGVSFNEFRNKEAYDKAKYFKNLNQSLWIVSSVFLFAKLVSLISQLVFKNKKLRKVFFYGNTYFNSVFNLVFFFVSIGLIENSQIYFNQIEYDNFKEELVNEALNMHSNNKSQLEIIFLIVAIGICFEFLSLFYLIINTCFGKNLYNIFYSINDLNEDDIHLIIND